MPETPDAQQTRVDLLNRALTALAPDADHRRTVDVVLQSLSETLSLYHLGRFVETIEAATLDVNRRLLAERYGPVLHADERYPAVHRG